MLTTALKLRSEIVVLIRAAKAKALVLLVYQFFGNNLLLDQATKDNLETDL